jgi:hypothetical protein
MPTKPVNPPPLIRPGQRVPDSGIYEDDGGRRVTLVRNEPAPPTSKPGYLWRQIVDTNPGDRSSR